MKPKSVKVDISSQRPDRSVGDAPGIGEVSKLKPQNGNDAASEEFDDLEDDLEPEEPGEWFIKLGMLCGLILGLLLAVGLIYYSVVRKLDLGAEKRTHDAGEARQSSVPTEEELSAISEEEARDLVRRALAIRFSSKVSEFFKVPEEINSVEVVSFLESMAESDGLITAMEWVDPAHSDHAEATPCVRVYFGTGENRRHRDARLLEDVHGVWKIDFVAFSQ